MRSARLGLFALVAAFAVAGSNPVHANTIAAPYLPPRPMKPDVPPQVSAAIVVLRDACADRRQPAPLSAARGAIAPMPRPPLLPPGRTLCEVAKNPGQAFLHPMLFSGIVGAILFFIGVLVFSLLRGVLISAWKWRMPIGTKSW